MRQQINLYQAVLIDKQEPLQARQAGLIMLLFLVLLLSLYLLGYWRGSGFKKNLINLKQQQSEKIVAVAALGQKFPERQKNALLEEEISQIRTALEGQKQILGYFAARDQGGNGKILDVLEGLARHKQQGVWLRRILLDASGQKITLSGSALKPEQVPRYLQSLGHEGVLAGQVFAHLKLTHIEERPGQVDFSLESRVEGQE
jgi:hypothetical protein